MVCDELDTVMPFAPAIMTAPLIPLTVEEANVKVRKGDVEAT
jgi:hypothetical protein